MSVSRERVRQIECQAKNRLRKIFARKRLMKAPPNVEPQGGHAAAGKWGFAAPGTFLLAVFFLATFVVYYAVNWKYLASVWPMS